MAIGTKTRIDYWVKTYPIELNGILIDANFNGLPLGAYNVFLSMHWLYTHKTKVDCHEKVIKCLKEDRERRMLQGKRKPTSVRMIKTL